MSSWAGPATLVDAIRAISVDSDESVAFSKVVDVALQEISGAELGGISELTRYAIRTRAASDPTVEEVDRAQYDSKQGPCFTAAVADAPVVLCNDVKVDERWPAFGQAATALGVNSVMSFKLFDGQETIGALNLYARTTDAFTPESQEVGSLLAAHAAVVMAASRKQANLNLALDTRDVIGQAKGILMERYKFDDRQAFEALIAVSQHTHRKLREVADLLRTTGELPGVDI